MDPAPSAFEFHRILSRGLNESGSQASGSLPGVRAANLCSATPTIVVGTPFKSTVFPTTAIEPPNTRCQ